MAFWAAMAWAADTPVCDWRNEMREAFVVAALPLLMIGLLGGMGGGTRAELAEPYWPFFTGGCGALDECCILWARIIVATFEPLDITLELSCLKTWPGDIDRAIPVAKNELKIYTYFKFRLKRMKLTWSRNRNARYSCRRLNYLCHAAHHWIRSGPKCCLLKRFVFYAKTNYFRFEIFDSAILKC